MTYGKWKALHPHTDEVEVLDKGVRLCAVCGGAIQKRSSTSGRQRKLYCSADCAYEATVVRNREFYHRKKERMMADGKI